jgi:hypothetical protein
VFGIYGEPSKLALTTGSSPINGSLNSDIPKDDGLQLAPLESQFIITAGTEVGSNGTLISLPTIGLITFTGTRSVRVIGEDGQTVGMLIGSPIDLDAECIVRDDLRVNTEGGVDTFIEREIYRLGGSFLFICDFQGIRRVYLDANGTKSLVYDPVKKVAGATAQSILDPNEYEERFDAALYDALGVDRDGWFPAGLTAHRGVERLICNHYLDLDSWECIRHWPCTEIIQTGESADKFDIINDCIRQTAMALSAAGQTNLSLTAGNETRMLLGACRHLLASLHFFTVNAPGGALDLAIAMKLAAQYQMAHTVLPYQRASAAQAQAWDHRAGHSLAGANRLMHPTMWPLSGEYHLGGLGGEVGRGFLWLSADAQTPISATDIADRLKLPRHPKVVARIEAWRAALAVPDALLLLDLAYLELRMSSWAYAQAYANPRIETHHPLTSRRAFVAMLSLPPEMRQDNGMIRGCIGRSWPELLDTPINRYGDWRDRFATLRKAIHQPTRAIRKARQLFLQRK